MVAKKAFDLALTLFVVPEGRQIVAQEFIPGLSAPPLTTQSRRDGRASRHALAHNITTSIPAYSPNAATASARSTSTSAL